MDFGSDTSGLEAQEARTKKEEAKLKRRQEMLSNAVTQRLRASFSSGGQTKQGQSTLG